MRKYSDEIRFCVALQHMLHLFIQSLCTEGCNSGVKIHYDVLLLGPFITTALLPRPLLPDSAETTHYLLIAWLWRAPFLLAWCPQPARSLPRVTSFIFIALFAALTFAHPYSYTHILIYSYSRGNSAPGQVTPNSLMLHESTLNGPYLPRSQAKLGIRNLINYVDCLNEFRWWSCT